MNHGKLSSQSPGEVIRHGHARKDRIRGLKFVSAPAVLRHFTARFAPAHGTLIAP
jgi:hypothetical protein